jgi:hypothetical protein
LTGVPAITVLFCVQSTTWERLAGVTRGRADGTIDTGPT